MSMVTPLIVRRDRDSEVKPSSFLLCLIQIPRKIRVCRFAAHCAHEMEEVASQRALSSIHVSLIMKREGAIKVPKITALMSGLDKFTESKAAESAS